MAARAGEVVASWTTGDGHRVDVYRTGRSRLGGRAQVWRWRRLAANARVVAVSGEPYTNQQDAISEATAVNPPVDPRSWPGRR